MTNVTQERRDANYNARMDWWNKDGKGCITEPISCIVGLVIMVVVVIIIGAIGMLIESLL